MSDRTWRIDDVELFYREIGAGVPLVALHGWRLDHRAQEESLEPVFADRPGWRRIYPDLPGHGRSNAPASITSHDDMLRTISRLVDSIAPGEHFAVAGTSYGALLARGLVHQRARQVAGVLLTTPSLGRENLPAHRVRHRDASFLSTLRPDEDKAEFAVWQTADVVEAMRRRFDSGVELADLEFLQRLAARSTFQSFDVSRLPEPFAKPALLVAGRFDDRCGYRGAFEILDDYPFATYAVLDGAGHGLTVEREPLYHALVRDWLERIEAEAGSIS